MKTISLALASHFASELSSLAQLVKITRTDGVVFGFTSHDVDLTLDAVTYKADGAFSSRNLKNAAELKGNSYEITGILDSALLSDVDLKAGLFDHARIDVYLCNWKDLSEGVLQVRRGWLGEVTVSDEAYTAELRGFQDLLQRRVGDVYTAECRHQFCDACCGKTKSSFLKTGAVTGVVDRWTFSDMSRTEEDNVFAYGQLTWTSGANKGLSMEIKSSVQASGSFSLWLPMPYDIAIGDAYSVVQGCDKKFSTCRDTFANAINFGGFPHLAGLAKILQYPDSQ